MELSTISRIDARIDQPVDETQLGHSVLKSIQIAEERLGVDWHSPDYEPVYDQN